MEVELEQLRDWVPTEGVVVAARSWDVTSPGWNASTSDERRWACEAMNG